jgi:hypothetical protein
MAEERALGLAHAENQAAQPSKEELQRRLGEARDSISNTVTEIKETVANQVQAVKDSLDWREQVKRRPIGWSAGAVGVGFCVGYCIAAFAKGDDSEYDAAIDRFNEESRNYSTQSAVTGAAMPAKAMRSREENGTHDSGPSFFQKVAGTQAFERVRNEAGNIGDALVQELSKTAKTVVLPAVMTSLRNFIGDYLPNAEKETSQQRDQSRPQAAPYQPSREH